LLHVDDDEAALRSVQQSVWFDHVGPSLAIRRA